MAQVPGPLHRRTPDRPRVLHLIQPWQPPFFGAAREPSADRCDTAALACRAALRESALFDHTVLLIGGTLAAERARSLGLLRFDRLAPPLGRLSLAARALRSFMIARGPFDIVHLWGESIARIEPWRADPRAITATDLTLGQVRLLPGMDFRTSGITRTLPPASLTARTEKQLALRRDATRAELGLQPTDVALAILADPPDMGEIARFAYLLSVLHTADVRMVGVVNSHGREERRGLSPQREALIGGRVIVTDHPMCNLLEACDVAVFGVGTRLSAAPQEATWRSRSLARIALDLGVLVVNATPGLVPAELERFLLSPSAHPATIARTLTRVWESPDMLASIRTLSRSLASTNAAASIGRTLEATWCDALGIPCRESAP